MRDETSSFELIRRRRRRSRLCKLSRPRCDLHTQLTATTWIFLRRIKQDRPDKLPLKQSELQVKQLMSDWITPVPLLSVSEGRTWMPAFCHSQELFIYLVYCLRRGKKTIFSTNTEYLEKTLVPRRTFNR